MNKKTILQSNIDQRTQEIFEYQVNIDNYKIAIDLASNDPDLKGFVDQLNHLLETSIIEQKKSKIMLQVAEIQLKELEDVPTD
jgi:hypothetical protein